MSNSGDFGKAFADESLGGAADVDLDVEQVIVDSGAHRLPPELGERRNPLFAFPLLAGVVFLIANIYVITRTPAIFTAKNTTGSTSLLLIIASVVLCLALIGYAFALRRSGAVSAKGVGIALLLGLLAPLATVWSLQVNRSFNDRQAPKPCIDVYEQAQNVAKDNPKFRMPAKDRDEVRCAVNATLGR